MTASSMADCNQWIFRIPTPSPMIRTNRTSCWKESGWMRPTLESIMHKGFCTTPALLHKYTFQMILMTSSNLSWGGIKIGGWIDINIDTDININRYKNRYWYRHTETNIFSHYPILLLYHQRLSSRTTLK